MEVGIQVRYHVAGHPTYHVNVIKLKSEIIWTGGLPHLSGVPHLYVNRPLEGHCCCYLISLRISLHFAEGGGGIHFECLLRPCFMNLILYTLQRELNTCSKLGMELEFFPKRCWHHKCTPLKYHYNKKPFTLF